MKGKNKFLAAAVFSLLSFGVVAGESYTCALDAKKTKGWIPSTIKISFNDDKQLTKLYSADYAYDYDLEIVKILRYTKDFREVKYISQHQTAKAGTKYRAIHTITILPKLNNKISYMLKFSAYSNHYNARGTCKKTELKQVVIGKKTELKQEVIGKKKTCSSTYKHNCQGAHAYENGTIYIGEWRHDQKYGQGKETYGVDSEWAGDNYVGGFKANKREGIGTYTYADGATYVGEWKNGKFNGQGKYTWISGKVEEGIWKDDEFQQTQSPAKSESVLKTANDTFVCTLATETKWWETGNEKKLWVDRSSTYFKYVTEANKRGLSCGVFTPSIPVSKTQPQSESQTMPVINQTQLAVNLLNGFGVAVDKEKAFNLLLLSATKRDPRALLWLGRMYKEGDGVLKNYKKAYMWLSLAALNGSKDSKAYLAAIEDLLDTRSLIEAQDLSSQCVEKNYQDC